MKKVLAIIAVVMTGCTSTEENKYEFHDLLFTNERHATTEPVTEPDELKKGPDSVG